MGTTTRRRSGSTPRSNRGSRRWCIAAVVVSLLLSDAEVATAGCWTPPVVGEIVDPFRAPPCPWCAGNRGLEYRVGADVAVRVAATGIVRFVGSVAGTTYVVVELPNGWRVTYGSILDPSVAVGDPVIAGSTIGRASATFFFGLRIGDVYTDPDPYLGTVVGRRRLIPIDGAVARPAPPARLRCTTAPSDRTHRN